MHTFPIHFQQNSHKHPESVHKYKETCTLLPLFGNKLSTNSRKVCTIARKHAHIPSTFSTNQPKHPESVHKCKETCTLSPGRGEEKGHPKAALLVKMRIREFSFGKPPKESAEEKPPKRNRRRESTEGISRRETIEGKPSKGIHREKPSKRIHRRRKKPKAMSRIPSGNGGRSRNSFSNRGPAISAWRYARRPYRRRNRCTSCCRCPMPRGR